MGINNKWMRAAVPALMIHCSVGTVYCWSTFKQAIAEQIQMSPFSVGWAFSLAIFFLGTSAAFFGRFVERDIHKSSLIACLCFTTGMLGTGFVIQNLKGTAALIGIYLCYGVIMGIGLGVGYLTPVKTLMLWFSDNKGLATGISIMGFGLAKAIATPIMDLIQNRLGIHQMFYILGSAYFVLMMTAHFLLKKPEGWVESATSAKSSLKTILKNKQFIGIWLMFYINIHCGLMIISYEKQILSAVFAGTASLAVIVSAVPSFTAGMNALGRIGYSTLSDKLKERNTVYKIIFSSCIAMTAITFIAYSPNAPYRLAVGVIIIAFLLIINAGYGGGFSTLPALLSERFGMKEISQIHGLTLSAWAVAGLTGNNTSELVLSHTNQNYKYIFLIDLVMFAVAMVICVLLVSNKPKEEV